MSRTLRYLSTFLFRNKVPIRANSKSLSGCKMGHPPSSNSDHGVFQLKIPECVRGMKTLDVDKFRTVVRFPTIDVSIHDLSNVRGKVRLEKYLLRNLNGLKSVVDSDDKSLKKLVFDPEVVQFSDNVLRDHIVNEIKNVVPTDREVQWSFLEREVDFNMWDMKRIIRAVLPDELDFSGFTQTGHIIHCNFRDDIIPYKEVLGEILVRKIQNCRTVVNKMQSISNEFRTFQLELVAGEPNYETELLEGGIKYSLDFSKVYWNSRLSHEHNRVVQLLDSRSLVYDACAGIGPFIIPAAKRKRPMRLFANDLNPDSVSWMKKNIAANKVPTSTIEVFNLDAVVFLRGPVARDITEQLSKIDENCDDKQVPSGVHIFMNLPGYAVNFLPSFRGMMHGKLDAAKTQRLQNSPPFAFTVYCYLFVKGDKENPQLEWFKEEASKLVLENLGCSESKVDVLHHVRTVSNFKEMFCAQISIPWSFLCAAPSKDVDNNDVNGASITKIRRISDSE